MRWFRFPLLLSISLLAICLVLTFNVHMSDEFGRLYLLTAFLNPLIGWGVIAYLLLWFQRNEKRCGKWLAASGVDSFGSSILHPIVLVVLHQVISFFSLNPWLIALSAIPLGIIFYFGIVHQLRRIPTVAIII